MYKIDIVYKKWTQYLRKDEIMHSMTMCRTKRHHAE